MKAFLRFLRRTYGLFSAEYQLAKFEKSHCGEGTVVGAGSQITRPEGVTVGRRCVIGEESWFNTNSDDPAKSSVVIGDFSFIGRRNFFNAGASIRLGDFCLTGPDCRFLGSDHNWESPHHPYIATGSTMDQSIVLGANVWLGAGATIIKGVTIGHGSIVGACSLVTHDVPPWSIVVGSPAKVVKRFDATRSAWVLITDWSEAAEQAVPSEEVYLEKIRKEHPRVHVPVIAGGAANIS